MEMELRLEPADAAELLPPADEVYAFRVIRPHTSVEATLVARSDTGREEKWRVAIAPQNAPPVLRLVQPDRFQPGDRLVFDAEVEDPEGDPVELEWAYEGAGDFRAEGASAELLLDPDDEGGSHRVEVRATDGIDASEATATFRAENAPPKIVELLVPERIEHECTDQSCVARARLEVVAEDVGPLRYAWYARGDHSGEVKIEGDKDPDPLFVLETFPDRPIAGTYPVEVHVRDASDALSTATVEVVVGNRPPGLVAHDESPLPHEPLSEGRYRWYREPGSVELWNDPDGDPALEVEWSSPDPRVHFSDARAIDPWIEIEGDEELLGARIPIAVVAQDPSGAEVAAEAELELGNRPPVILEFSPSGFLGTTGYGDAVLSIRTRVEDPDGDPVKTTLLLDPERPPLPQYGLRARDTAHGWTLRSSKNSFEAHVIFVAEDPFGAISLQRELIVIDSGSEW